MTPRRRDDEDTLTARPTPAPPDWLDMANDITFRISTTRFDEDYAPSSSSRITTNFANLARGEHRRQNLRNALAMIDRRFNELADADNPSGDRYRVELDIVSAELQFDDAGDDRAFPLLEVLDIHVVDTVTGERHQGIVGNNFSSYLRDYDFSVLLPAANGEGKSFTLPEDFGILHGKLFQHFLDSEAYRERYTQSPVVCISVSTSRTYHRTGVVHPVLGHEYEQDSFSLTDEYFAKMGLQVRYFMPRGSVARWRSTSAAICSPTTPTCSWRARWPRWRRSRRSTAPRSTTRTSPRARSTAPRWPTRTSPARTSRTTARSAAAWASRRAAIPRSTS